MVVFSTSSPHLVSGAKWDACSELETVNHVPCGSPSAEHSTIILEKCESPEDEVDVGRIHSVDADGHVSHYNDNHAFTGPIHDHHAIKVIHEVLAKISCLNSSTWVSASEDGDAV